MATATKKNGKASKATKTKIVAQNATGSDRKAKATEGKPTNGNPYRPHGGYWASVEALKSLGVGKLHGFDKIVAAVSKAMGAKAWIEFSARKPRNKETGKNASERAIQNVSTVARKKDYGKPLVEAGFEVRFDGRAKQAGLFKIGK